MSEQTKAQLPGENIVLIGFMGSGKSSIGRRLARRLRFQFLDTDRLVEERAKMTIPEIFKKYGEANFRERETAALDSLLGARRHILATGGGVVTQPGNIPLLRRLGLVVLLSADPEEIFRRVSRNTQRPLLQVENPRQRVLDMMAARRAAYLQAAEFEIDTTKLRHDEVADAILDKARTFFGWPEPAKTGQA